MKGCIFLVRTILLPAARGQQKGRSFALAPLKSVLVEMLISAALRGSLGTPPPRLERDAKHLF